MRSPVNWIRTFRSWPSNVRRAVLDRRPGRTAARSSLAIPAPTPTLTEKRSPYRWSAEATPRRRCEARAWEAATGRAVRGALAALQARERHPPAGRTADRPADPAAAAPARCPASGLARADRAVGPAIRFLQHFAARALTPADPARPTADQVGRRPS